MQLRVSLILATLAFSTVSFAQSDAFQISYASNLNIGDSVINITNSGATVANGVSQNLCIKRVHVRPG
jgi:hypothetical protein